MQNLKSRSQHPDLVNRNSRRRSERQSKLRAIAYEASTAPLEGLDDSLESGGPFRRTSEASVSSRVEENSESSLIRIEEDRGRCRELMNESCGGPTGAAGRAEMFRSAGGDVDPDFRDEIAIPEAALMRRKSSRRVESNTSE